MSHTPGPWEVVCDGPAFSLAVHAALDGDVDGDTGQHIVTGGELIAAIADTGDAEANAHLIKAAPTLLEALEAAVPHLRAYADDELLKGYGLHSDTINACAEEAIAAINAATGGQQ